MTEQMYLYRYLDKKFVDEFFNNGVLRLSSFKEFAKHPHELCRDAKEGSGMIVNQTTEGKGQTIMANISQGFSAYILCGSSIYKSEIAEKFQTNSGFRIDDIKQFADVISSCIPGFTFGTGGYCEYVPERVVRKNAGFIDIEKMKNPNGTIYMEDLFGALFNIAGDNLLFLKEDIYADEHEIRIIWNTSNSVENYIDVKCPDARKFCTRFEGLT